MTTTILKLLVEARAAARTGSGARLRQSLGLSQSELARAAAIHPATLNRWESGERQPTGEAALRYARVLRVLASESKGNPEEEPPKRAFALIEDGKA